MEILNSFTFNDKTITLDQTINFNEENFLTIKEIFSINEEVFVAFINHQIPFTIVIKDFEMQTNRFFMPAKLLITRYYDKF